MDISLVLKSEEVMLANTLKNIYYICVVEDEHDDDSILLKDIVSMVENSIEKQKDAFDHSSGVSYFFLLLMILRINFWKNIMLVYLRQKILHIR